MNKAALGARILLGLIFTVFGINGFLQFLPMPPMNEAAQAYMGALFQTGFFFPVLKGTEVICGVMLLTGLWVPLALTVLAPIVIQIFLFHAFIAGDVPMSVFIILLEVFLAYQYRAKFAGVLSMK